MTMKQLGIHYRIFLSFTAIILFMVGLLSYFNYKQAADLALKRSLESSHQILYRLNQSMEETIKTMDRFSAQVIFNPQFQQYFNDPVPLNDSSDYQAFEIRRGFENTLAAMNSPNLVARQVNVFNLQGDFISYSLSSNGYTDRKARYPMADWIQPTLQLAGEKMLVPPHRSEWDIDDHFVFSLTRAFPVPKNESPALIELQQPYSLLEKWVGDTLGGHVYIYDSAGRLFYPAQEDRKGLQEPPYDWKRFTPSLADQIADVQWGSSFISLYQSSYSNLTYGLVLPEAIVLQPVKRLRATSLSVASLTFVLALLLSYWVSATITRPIKKVQRVIRSLDFSNLNVSWGGSQPKFSGEMRELLEAVVHMKDRLNHSLNRLVESQQREAMAQFQSMQAQMNPHFLYNTLSSIGYLAEEDGAERLSQMCYKLTGMMRYVGLPVSEGVALKQEADYIVSYLELLKLRYEDDFAFEIRLDPALEQIPVPKFSLQPFVENAYKHGFQFVQPPWRTSVEIKKADNGAGMVIRIQDNGCGFSPQALEEVRRITDDLHVGTPVNPDELLMQAMGGLGLVNTFHRIWLFWNGRVRFRIDSTSEGSEITILIDHTGG